jgi:hypothetical protein
VNTGGLHSALRDLHEENAGRHKAQRLMLAREAYAPSVIY